MADARLRLYRPEDEDDRPRESRPEPAPAHPAAQGPRVEVRVADLFPILARAREVDSTWLRDFQDERVLISRDLFELAYTYARLGTRASGT